MPNGPIKNGQSNKRCDFMKRILLFLSSFIITVGAAAALWLGLHATPFQREYLRAWFNNPKAQFRTAYAFRNGIGVEPNPEKARYWYAEAAARGSAEAAVNLGLMTLKGAGGIQDGKAALELFKTAAAKGSIKGQMNAARCAFLGVGMEKNEAEGAAFVKKAADSGAQEAVALMGILSLGGIGVPQDHDVAIKWLKKSDVPEAKDLAAKLDAENTILDALPPETRAEKWKDVYARMEAGIRAAFTQILEKEMTPETML